jgi:DNA-binding HxlR family transcriptional regulator
MDRTRIEPLPPYIDPPPLEECALASAIAEIGDRWTLLILREAMCGVTRFDTMRDDLGIPRSVLADRLRELTRRGIMEKFTYRQPPKRAFRAYRLTAKGRALAPALVALRQWANEYVLARPSRFEFVEAEGQTVSTRLVRQDGRTVEAGSVLARVVSR